MRTCAAPDCMSLWERLQSPGLTDYLRGEVDEMAIVQHGLDGNLCFIPGGNEVTNPSELLSNGRLKTLLDHLTPVFDWIILDSAPLLPVADSSSWRPGRWRSARCESRRDSFGNSTEGCQDWRDETSWGWC